MSRAAGFRWGLLVLIALAMLVAWLQLGFRRLPATARPAEPGAQVTGATPRELPGSETDEAVARTEHLAGDPAALGEPDPPRGPLIVRVVEPSGAGVDGAVVALCCLGFDGCAYGADSKGTTDELGVCEIDASDLGCATWWASAIRPPYLVSGARVLADDESVELTALLPARLSGRVRWSDGTAPGEPYAFIGCTAVHPVIGRASTRVQVVGGRYEIPGVIGRVERLSLVSEAEPNATIEPDLELHPGDDVRFDLELDSPVPLRATCRDRTTGEPIAGVRLVEPRRGKPSDAAGVLEVSRVIFPGTTTRVRFEHEDYAPAVEVVESRAGANVIELDLELDRSPVLHGVVEDRSGRPLAHARIEVARRIGGRTTIALDRLLFTSATSADTEGRFRISGLPLEGAVDVVITHDDKLRLVESVDLSKAAERERWIAPDPIGISGTILDSAGEPVHAAALLRMRGAGWRTRNFSTDPGGRFELSDVCPGRWLLELDHGPTHELDANRVRSRSLLELDVREDATRFELRLDPPRAAYPIAPIRIRVVDADTGQALMRSIELAFVGIDVGYQDVWRGESGDDDPSDGTAVVRVPAGTYEVLASARGYLPGLRTVLARDGLGVEVIRLGRR